MERFEPADCVDGTEIDRLTGFSDSAYVKTRRRLREANVEYKMPDLGEGILEAELIQWMVAPGDVVEVEQSLAEVMTDKAVIELPSPFVGTVAALKVAPGDSIAVGGVLIEYDPKRSSGEAPAEESATKPSAAPAAKPSVGEQQRPEPNGTASQIQRSQIKTDLEKRPLAAPAVRKLAERLGIDLRSIAGSGPDGRILIDDLAASLQSKEPSRREKPRRDGPALGVAGTRTPVLGVRRKISERMERSKRTIPDYSYVDECDVTQLVQLRSDLQPTLARERIHLTYLPFFVKAVVGALKDVPIVNSSLDEEANEIVMHDCYHIGIATSTPHGLVVPVLRNADRMGLRKIAAEIERMSGQARSGRVRHEDLGGSTFTITSIGGIGGLFSTPIINHPEVGILGVGQIVKRPICDANGAIRSAEMVYLSFSFDHRVVDGAVGATFGNAVIERLSRPRDFQ